ncbi:MAG TPA: GGDEF domain-containing protein [Solirubrobacteraceae bacterium]
MAIRRSRALAGILDPNRDSVAAQLRSAEARAEAAVAERNALGDLTTAIAHHKPVERVHELITGYAVRLIGGRQARLEPAAGTRDKSTVGRVRAVVTADQEQWGTLVLEGVNASELPAARLQLLQHFADLAGLAVATSRTRAQLATQALSDPLTGLANQRAFHRELVEELSRARRHHHPLALILLDLDNFKRINDANGPAAGDRALIEAAKRIRETLRLETHIARLGGDELALLLPECDAQGAFAGAERVRAAINAAQIPGGHRLTASAGVAALEQGEDAPLAGASADDLIHAAHTALFTAKRFGGNTTMKFTPRLGDAPAPVPLNPEARRAPRVDAAQSA